MEFFQIDVTKALENLFNRKPSQAKNEPPRRTFKLKRAQMNHLQTLREISAQKDEEIDESTAGTSS